MHSSKRTHYILLVTFALCLFIVGCSAQKPDAVIEDSSAINSSDMEQTPISTPAESVAVHSDQSTANANILIPSDIKMEVMSGEERNVKFNYVLPKTGNQNIDNSLMMFCNMKLMEAVGTAQKDGITVELYLNLDVYEHNGGGAFVYTGELRHGNRETEEILFINHYNMSSGKEFSLMDVFPVEQASALQSAIAQKFAAQYPSADPAKIADTVMPIFALSKNFIQTDSGLVYLWLASEIDSTASWITQAFLTNEELQAISASTRSVPEQLESSPQQHGSSENAVTAQGDLAYLVTDKISEEALTQITNMFSIDGVGYITLDYVQVQHVMTEEEHTVPVVVNTNPKLRTFEIANDCKILLPSNAGTKRMGETNERATLEDLITCYSKLFGKTPLYFDVQIKDGKLVKCELWTMYYFGD